MRKSLSSKILWFIISNAFCETIRIMPAHSPLSKPIKMLLLRSERNMSIEWLLLTPD